MLRVDEARLGCTRSDFVEALRADGIPASAGYIACALYQYPVFAKHNFFDGRWPVKELGLTQMDYTKVHCPIAEEILATAVCIQVNETRSEAWATQVGRGIQKVAAHFAP
jgi:dTDP-4-amino-4,6-dideoxygalactose transaminase